MLFWDCLHEWEDVCEMHVLQRQEGKDEKEMVGKEGNVEGPEVV